MNIRELIRPDLLDLEPYSSARDEYKGKEGVFLDANENPFDNGVNRYPDPLQKGLKARISELKTVPEQNIFLGNGSDECIDLLLRLFGVPMKDSIVAISPSYGMYQVSAKINQIKVRNVLLNADFTLNSERILDAAIGAKMIFICSPNNPTGNVFTKKEIINLAESFNGLIIVDEAYIDFSDTESLSSEIEQYPNLVILQTLSKAYGMAALRLGMLFASSEIITWLNKIKPPYNISQLTQSEVLKLLKDDQLVKDQILELKSQRKRLEVELSKLNSVEKIFPSEANFILIKVIDSNKIYKELINSKIITRNRSTQPLCNNCIRITVGTKQENDLLLKGMNELNQI